MQRGKNQIMFRYLPENVIDFSDTHTIVKVKSWNSTRVDVDGFNIDKIFYELSNRRLKRYPFKNGYPDKPSSKSFVFLEPKGVNVELFPLTFICSKCNKSYSFSDFETFRKSMRNKNYHCSCGGTLKQLDLVHYHNCGNIESPKVPKCNRCGYENVQLYKGGSRKVSDWKWKCGKCGEVISNVINWCNECEEWMRLAPFRESQVFYPHSFSLINTVSNYDIKNYEDVNNLKLYLAKYLGIISQNEYNSIKNADKEINNDNYISEKRQKLLLKGYPIDQINEILDIMDMRPTSEKSERYNEIIKEIDECIKVSPERLKSLTSSLQGFIETIELHKVQTIDDIIENAKNRAESNYTTIRQFKNALKDIGVSNSYVISDIPLVTVVYGYSRMSYNPQETTLRAFPRDKNYPEQTPIYVNACETEGILLEIDRYKILKWLNANNIINELPSNDEKELKSWFLNNVNIDSIPLYDEISNNNITTKYVYSLLHTMSHVLIRKASGLVGVDKDSMGEIIFPSIPAILIYTNNVNNLQIGGMHTLFETGIIPWTEMAVESASSCLYDPVCISSNASCHACLHLSEGTCEHFNRDLGRHYLIGRNIDGNKTIGFWEKSFTSSLKNEI